MWSELKKETTSRDRRELDEAPQKELEWGDLERIKKLRDIFKLKGQRSLTPDPVRKGDT